MAITVLVSLPASASISLQSTTRHEQQQLH